MIKHLIKMVWNRKRTNFLITIEIFISFLVLFGVMVFVVYYVDNYRRPLGYKIENVWCIDVNRSRAYDEDNMAEHLELTKQMLKTLQGFDEIEYAAGANTPPYSLGTDMSSYDQGGRRIEYRVDNVSDDFNKVMGLTITRGRWFSKDDQGLAWDPVVINEKFARFLFGDEDPVGKDVPAYEGDGSNVRKMRIIGAILDFRKEGEFSEPVNYVFYRNDFVGENKRPPRSFLIKVRPEITAAFEEKILAALQPLAKDWSFKIRPIAQMRETIFKLYLTPLIAGGTVAGFLMIMVALGLTGVLWQNVTQRTREIGLRRAKGATVGKIYGQILGELLIVTTIGVALGTAVAVQLPILNLMGFISGKVYVYGLTASQALIYLLTLICGIYPSRLATRVQPAEALHYE